MFNVTGKARARKNILSLSHFECLSTVGDLVPPSIRIQRSCGNLNVSSLCRKPSSLSAPWSSCHPAPSLAGWFQTSSGSSVHWRDPAQVRHPNTHTHSHRQTPKASGHSMKPVTQMVLPASFCKDQSFLSLIYSREYPAHTGKFKAFPSICGVSERLASVLSVSLTFWVSARPATLTNSPQHKRCSFSRCDRCSYSV